MRKKYLLIIFLICTLLVGCTSTNQTSVSDEYLSIAKKLSSGSKLKKSDTDELLSDYKCKKFSKNSEYGNNGKTYKYTKDSESLVCIFDKETKNAIAVSYEFKDNAETKNLTYFPNETNTSYFISISTDNIDLLNEICPLINHSTLDKSYGEVIKNIKNNDSLTIKEITKIIGLKPSINKNSSDPNTGLDSTVYLFKNNDSSDFMAVYVLHKDKSIPRIDYIKSDSQYFRYFTNYDNEVRDTLSGYAKDLDTQEKILELFNYNENEQ